MGQRIRGNRIGLERAEFSQVSPNRSTASTVPRDVGISDKTVDIIDAVFRRISLEGLIRRAFRAKNNSDSFGAFIAFDAMLRYNRFLNGFKE
jgi:hypothetical protein